jgi:hypothetical protein
MLQACVAALSAIAIVVASPAYTQTAEEPSLPSANATPAPSQPAAQQILPVGTRLHLRLEDNISSVTSKPGDSFRVTVLEDVKSDETVVIPAGTHGRGEVTFVTNRGDFGKPGILSMEMREIQLGDRSVPVDGRYREEGKNKTGATTATFFAVGIFAGFIKGKVAVVEKGRELGASTGGDIAFVRGAPPPAIVIPDWPIPHSADATADPSAVANSVAGSPELGRTENSEAKADSSHASISEEGTKP